MVPVELQQGTQDSFQVAAGAQSSSRAAVRDSGFHLRRGVELFWGTQSSSRVVAGNSVFLSGCNRGVRPPLEVHWGTECSRVVEGSSGFF